MLDIEVIVKLYPVGKCADCTVLLKIQDTLIEQSEILQ